MESKQFKDLEEKVKKEDRENRQDVLKLLHGTSRSYLLSVAMVTGDAVLLRGQYPLMVASIARAMKQNPKFKEVCERALEAANGTTEHLERFFTKDFDLNELLKKKLNRY